MYGSKWLNYIKMPKHENVRWEYEHLYVTYEATASEKLPSFSSR